MPGPYAKPVDQETLGGRVRFWRIKRGLKQDQLARKVRLSKSFISLLETNRSAPSVDSIAAIADALGLRLDYLIRGQGRPLAPRAKGAQA